VRFWDSSALVPLLVRQRASTRMPSLYRADPVHNVHWRKPVNDSSVTGAIDYGAFGTSAVMIMSTS
jgi:hypothetical protein